MGKLLDIAIAGSKAAAAPTLSVTVNRNPVFPGQTKIYKNGILFGTYTDTFLLVSVPIVAGNTFYIVIESTGSPVGFAYFQYFLNGTLITDVAGVGVPYTSATYTAVSGNVYDLTTDLNYP